ncbi:MAG: energy transducer TonB [Bacteroidales bacterium]|nr:energy transducer TonB [Bacteroidales bacterium]
MKTIFLFLFAGCFILPSTAQSPRTAVIVNDSGDNLVKEIYLVRADDENIKEGTYQQFFGDSLITRGRYSDNKKTGLWEFFDYSGKLDFYGYYDDDLKDGKWVYSLNGKTTAQLYFSQGKTDSIFGFFENGFPAVKVWKFPDGSGKILTYYDNGKLKEEQPTQNGKPHGLYKVYFKNGQLHREALYDNAGLRSVISTFDMEGKPVDGGSLKDGEGNLVSYYLYDTSGVSEMKKYSILGFSNGALNGIASHYFENGRLESSGFTEAGYTTSEWKYYLEDGNVKHMINYNYSPFNESRKLIKPEVYSAARVNTGQRNPEFQGGEKAWLTFLEKTIHFPKGSDHYLTLGIVYVDFVVSDIGRVVSGRVVKSVNKSLDAEALRVIDEMPRWNPGLSYGVPVSMIMNMPMSFNIE